MIEKEKEVVPYKQALALKELEFNEPCLAYYLCSFLKDNFQIKYGITNKNLLKYDKDNKNRISAPLYQQAFRWFREKYGLESYINPELPFSYNNPKYTVIFIKTTKNFITYTNDTIWIRENIERKRFNSYEEAELKCLKKLIEIIKRNKNERIDLCKSKKL